MGMRPQIGHSRRRRKFWEYDLSESIYIVSRADFVQKFNCRTSNRWPSTLSELAQNLGAKQALAL